MNRTRRNWLKGGGLALLGGGFLSRVDKVAAMQTESAAPRARRAKTGTLKMPMAMMELTAPGPSRAVIMTAVSSAGKAKAKSLNRMTASLTVSPR